MALCRQPDLAQLAMQLSHLHFICAEFHNNNKNNNNNINWFKGPVIHSRRYATTRLDHNALRR